MECRKELHLSIKKVSELNRAPNENTGNRCLECYHQSHTMSYELAIETGKLFDFDLVSTEEQFEEALKKVQTKDKPNRDIVLKWRHKDCDRVIETSYNNMLNSHFCMYCDSGINQLALHHVAEYIFDQEFEAEKRIWDIFPELRDMFHQLTSLDSYAKLNLYMSDGTQIKLALERQGRQHDDTPGGYNYYLSMNGLKANAHSYKGWRRLIKNDRNKVEAFRRHNADGYFLIVVRHNIPRWRMQEYIYQVFKETLLEFGEIIDIDEKPHFYIDKFLSHRS